MATQRIFYNEVNIWPKLQEAKIKAPSHFSQNVYILGKTGNKTARKSYIQKAIQPDSQKARHPDSQTDIQLQSQTEQKSHSQIPSHLDSQTARQPNS